MYVPFTTKYQPTTLEEFEFPSEIKDAIKNVATVSGLSMLLTGPSGSGKTSLARTLAIQTDGDGCSAAALVVNSVGDNGISYFRNEVKTFCRSNCKGKRKVVVIDDVDNLNDQSQQVLRSTIETFAPSVQFIATASSEHKLVDGIASRFTTISLQLVSQAGLQSIAQKVCKAENIHLDDDALSFVLSTCSNSPRALLRTLDRMALTLATVTLEDCHRLCVAVDDTHYKQLLQNALDGNAEAALATSRNMCESGYSPIDILDGLFHALPRLNGLADKNKYELTKTIARYVATCHSCHTDQLQLKLFVLEIFNVVRL